MKTTAIIIDDEQRARVLLKGLLNEIAPEVDVIAECADLSTGVVAIRKNKPKLVFLDIEMSGHSGLEILDFFGESEIDFDIIFVTAYNQFAIKAFKLSAIDYILKPIDPVELKNAVDRHLKSTADKQNDLSVLKANLQNNIQEKIAVPSGNSIKFISPDEILFIKADSSYSEIHFQKGGMLVVSRTLKNFEAVLDEKNGFLRLHKSYLVNVNQITEFIKSDGGSVIMSNSVQLAVSPDKTTELLEMMKMIKR